MDMKNVAQLVCILSMLEQSDIDYESVRNICIDEFGGEYEYAKVMNTVLSNWNNQSEGDAEKLFLSLLREVHIAIKQDLEADAQRAKENAS